MSKQIIQPGELVYLYHPKSSFMVPFSPNSKFSTHKGELRLLEEHCWGDVISNHNNTEMFSFLRPTLADRVMKVKRATTISYPKDIGAVIVETDIFSGANVLEIGTGSAAFSIAISGIVGETGRIYSFERRAEHQAIAVKNFAKLARYQNAEFILKDDVHETGFGLTQQMDTMYIDVPVPSPLLPAIKDTLRPGGNIVFILPCVEQLTTLVHQLPQYGFTRIRSKEILERGIRVIPGRTRPDDRMVAHTVYLLFASLSNHELKESEITYEKHKH